MVAYRCRFAWPGGAVMAHVSADERYELWLDGQRVGRGPQRGVRRRWFYDSYRLEMEPGDHTLVARVWSLGDSAPYPQLTLRHGLICGVADPDGNQVDVDQTLLGTGVASWEWRKLDGLDPIGRNYYGTGRRECWDGAKLDWLWTTGDGDGWQPVAVGSDGRTESMIAVLPMDEPGLCPAVVTRRFVRPWTGAQVRYLDDAVGPDPKPCRADAHRADDAAHWQRVWDGGDDIVIAPMTRQRVVVDMNDYATGYFWFTVEGGVGAEIGVSWAEALFDGPDPATAAKGNRNEVTGRWFLSRHLTDPDTFQLDGRSQRFETLWWRAGRYAQIEVTTASAPLRLTGIGLEETRHALEDAGSFESDDPRWPALLRCCRRSLQVNAHETYMDTPYHEQQQWVGDARVQALCGYAMQVSTELQRAAIDVVATSRTPAGWVSAFYPVRQELCIPSFSLAWVHMLVDLAWWRGERAFVAGQAPVARGVLDWFWRHRDAEGLVEGMPGWLYLDWAGWKDHAPPGSFDGPVTTLNAFLLYTIESMARMEEWLGEPERAACWERRADELSGALVARCWDATHGRFVDAPGLTATSEHAHALAALSTRLRDRLGDPLVSALGHEWYEARCSLFFHHYFFEACAATRQADVLHRRLEPWFALPDLGFTATPEVGANTRSDSHAWSAHPLYHARATIAGIRPSEMGFKRVAIRPMPGTLKQVRASMPHPDGVIDLTLRHQDGQWTGVAVLPPGLVGEYSGPDGRRQELTSGINRLGTG
jgi:hypothetical protein